MASTTPRSFAFVPADDLGKPTVHDRKLIRSHCMRGKNRRNKRTGSNVGTPGQPQASHDALQAAQSPLLSLSVAVPSKERRFRQPRRHNDGKAVDDTVNAREDSEAVKVASMIPAPPPRDILLFKFVQDVDRPSQELIFKYFTIARDLVYPAEICIDYDPSRALWFQWMSSDAAYLHSVLLCTSFIQDFVTQSQPTTATFRHLRKTLTILNERLSDRSESLQDSTFATVITLAQGSEFLGDYAASKAHIAGLAQMVRLRGGLDAFRGNSKLHIKLRHVDIVFALKTGEQPRFFAESTYRAQPLDGKTAVRDAEGYGQSHQAKSLDSILDHRLAAIFGELRQFTRLINGAIGNKRRVRDSEFSNIICSIQYRLLQLQGRLENILDESVRLATLALLTTTTRVPGKDRFPHLTRRLRECICAVEPASPQLQDLVLWMLTVGAFSVFDIDEPWLRERWHAHVPQLAWPETQRRLREILWIEAIHDEPGRRVFEAMTCDDVLMASRATDLSESRRVLPDVKFIQVAIQAIRSTGA